MKIAIFSDPHLGYHRFEEDSYIQAERTIVDATEKADLILCGGDIFDTKVPKLETLKRAVEIFNKSKIPIFAIFGNHERRAKEFVNPAQLLAASTGIKLLHGETAVFEKNGEKILIFGVGSVPEEYATEAIRKTVNERFKKEENAFSILMMHQSIKELIPGAEEEVSLEFLETLPFDLIVNGHLHETVAKLDGKFLIPGSTVITQLKKNEMANKGYYLYDTVEDKAEFIEIETRKFFYEELDFKDAGEREINEKVKEKIEGIRKEYPEALIAIKLNGNLKEGISGSDIKIDEYENTFIENRLNVESLGAKLEMIRNSRQENLSVRDLALKELKAKTEGKINLFDSAEIFEKLILGTDETLEYLEKRKESA
ncbi:metallophosphoesterase [Candidatus Micrarchaeota archaeon]|nr:metallophosphoesterase [Candidatus Micrarchaeota archaeon]